MGGSGLSAPDWDVCVHCWVAGTLEDHKSVHRWEDRASPRQFWAFVYTVVSRATPRGGNSVHKWAMRASPRRFGAFVYTVGLRAWVVGGLGITIVYTNGWQGPSDARLGRLCTLLGCGRLRVAAIVYTDGRIGALCASFGRLCTLLNYKLWAAPRRATFRRRRRASRARQSRCSASQAWSSHRI